MRPPKRDTIKFEKVAIGEMITGIIEEVQYDEKHTFKGFQGGPDTNSPAIRFKLKLDNYEFPHFSRWMRFNLGSKSNLFNKYISKLIENAHPDMDIDLDVLKGVRIKTVWSENGDFQNIEAIFPNGSKIDANSFIPADDLPAFEDEDAK